MIAVDNSPKMVEFGSRTGEEARIQKSRIPAGRHRRSADCKGLGRPRDFQPGAASRHPSGARHRRGSSHSEKRRAHRDSRSARAIASKKRANSTPTTGWASAKCSLHQLLETSRIQRNRSERGLARKREPAFPDRVRDWSEIRSRGFAPSSVYASAGLLL